MRTFPALACFPKTPQRFARCYLRSLEQPAAAGGLPHLRPFSRRSFRSSKARRSGPYASTATFSSRDVIGDSRTLRPPTAASCPGTVGVPHRVLRRKHKTEAQPDRLSLLNFVAISRIGSLVIGALLMPGQCRSPAAQLSRSGAVPRRCQPRRRPPKESSFPLVPAPAH